MSEWITDHEAPVRLGFFFGIFALMALWEVVAPRRSTTTRAARWPANLGIVLLDTLMVRILFPSATIGTAWLAVERGWGLLNNVELPFGVAFILSVLGLDLVIYLQHVLFHAVPALWRLHMVHHADLDFDVTTAARFHPIEIVLSMLIKLAVISALGPPVLGALAFEVILNGTAMFNHSNVRIPRGIDRVLRWLVVTPDMHRVHHSVTPIETNTNFGFNLPWWDRLFGTYADQPSAGHEGMTIGLRQFRDPRRLTLPCILAMPFVGKPGGYPMNPRSRR